MVGRNMSLKNPVTPPGINPRTVRSYFTRTMKNKTNVAVHAVEAREVVDISV
jgi:hypothetical protein